MVALLFGSAIIGVPIGLALISSCVVYLLMRGLPLTVATDSIMQGLNSNFVLLAIPLFIFAARVMNAGTITDRLLSFAVACVGHFRGGLAQVNVLTSLIFSGMSGSATADAAGVGTVLIKMMREKDRYPAGFAGAITAASSVIGPVFPPSIPMIFYAIAANASIGALFLGGIIPALLITLMLMGMNWVIAVRRGFPTEARASFAAIAVAAARALIPLLTPVILLGGIYSGAMTPTEAAAAAGAYALIVAALVFRSLTPKEFWNVLLDSAHSSAVVLMIIAGSFLFSYVIAIERLPNALADWVGSWDVSPTLFFLLVNVVFLLLGTVLSVATILLVIVPVVVPTVLALGVDPIHFGVVIVINTMIGLITPPYGVLLFVVAGINRIETWSLIREIVPFIAILIASLLILVLVPDLVLFLPHLFGFKTG